MDRLKSPKDPKIVILRQSTISFMLVWSKKEGFPFHGKEKG